MNTQPPVEDINAIVGRFQAWAGAQPSATPRHGIRELTYEEAVRPKQRRASLKVAPSKKAEAAPAATQKAKVTPKAKLAKPAKRTAAPRHTRRDAQSGKQTEKLVAKPVFRHVLADTVAMVPAVARPLAVESRTTALSLRISSAEHALFKERAAEADVSVSAYLRQCALEVEALRTRVKQLSAATNLPPISIPQRSATGTFAQFIRGIFGMKTTTMRLRA